MTVVKESHVLYHSTSIILTLNCIAFFLSLLTFRLRSLLLCFVREPGTHSSTAHYFNIKVLQTRQNIRLNSVVLFRTNSEIGSFTTCILYIIPYIYYKNKKT